MKSIETVADLKGKKVMVRSGLNVPLVNGVVRDDFRIAKALETITFLQNAGARVVVVGHIGREASETLKPVFLKMKEYINLSFSTSVVGDHVVSAIEELQDGEVILLENLRSHEGEKKNDSEFSKELASYVDVFVQDAFSVGHRAHASIVGVPQHVPSYAGFQFMREYANLSKALEPQHQALFILGGAKFETKMPLLLKFIDVYDHVFVGGALMNDVLKAKGYEVGKSLVSDVVDLKDSGVLDSDRLIMPTDVVVEGSDGKDIKGIDAVKSDDVIVDIGPSTVTALSSYIGEAKTIVWNGPMGNYEQDYTEGTEGLVKYVASSGGLSILGGGDTVAAVRQLGLEEACGFMSTAGGAMLSFLESGTLPAIEALE
jgi:phosphoglycerate kinase